jgi:hypothetical protein
MTPLVTIPYVDNRGRTPVDLLECHAAGAHALVKAATTTYGAAGRIASLAALPLGDRASRAWLERARNPYRGEIAAMAKLLGRDGVWFLNVCFEWGCTGGVWESADGARLRRVLDWPFPALGEHILVVHQSGAAGDFLNVTWPGVAGIYQASAPGRFAAAINQAPMREYGAGFVGDWLRSRVAVGRTGALPPAHLLRRVFETAPDYQAAKTMLCETPLAVLAIFILSGVGAKEGAIVERTEDACALREIADGRVCATNHFVGRTQGWRARPIDSEGRLGCALALDGEDDAFAWFSAPIANANSRLAMTAQASSGALAVMGTQGGEPVTEVFRL